MIEFEITPNNVEIYNCNSLWLESMYYYTYRGVNTSYQYSLFTFFDQYMIPGKITTKIYSPVPNDFIIYCIKPE